MKRLPTWCSEEAVSWFIASILKSEGFWPLLGVGSEKFIVLSKSELSTLISDLGANFIQGRHRVDVVCYSDSKFVLGLVVSRMLPLTIRVSDECCKLALEMVLADPKSAVRSYWELRQRGFDFTSMNVAKMCKIVVGCLSSGRLRRFVEGREIVAMGVILGLKPCIDYARSALESLREYLSAKGIDVRLSLYVFKPLDVSSGPPVSVLVRHVWGSKVIEDVRKSFSEVMGSEWIGCRKCRYIGVCLPNFGR